MRIGNAWFLLATLGLAAGAVAQTQSPAPGSSVGAQSTPQATGPAAASSPHQRNVTGESSSEAAPNTHTGPLGASSPHQRRATHLAEAGSGSTVTEGMTVTDRSGQTIGTVSKVTPTTSRHRYVVVSGTEGGDTTPVPYAIASSTTADGKVVLDREAFEQAPKIKPGQASGSTRSFQTKVDQYWRKHAR